MQDTSPDSTPLLAAASLFAGLCRLIPVPFIDKFLLRHVYRQMIASLLSLHDIECKPSDIYPLYKNHHGCLVNMLLMIFVLPFILIHKLVVRILKWLFFIVVVRETAIEMGKIILLGHTIERCLVDGRIPPPENGSKKSKKVTFKAAVKCKKRFNKVFKGSDWRFLVHLFRGTVKSFKKVPNLMKITIKMFKKESSENTIKSKLRDIPEREQQAARTMIEEIAELMKNDEMQKYITNFDKMFDSAFPP